MRRTIPVAALTLLAVKLFGAAPPQAGQAQAGQTQAAPSQPPPAAATPPVTAVLSPGELQFAEEVLRTAIAFNSTVRNMNLQQTFKGQNGGQPNAVATAIGAGVGAGAAIGAMSGKQKGMLIGAAAGGAGALILEEILKHRAESNPAPVDAPPVTLQTRP